MILSFTSSFFFNITLLISYLKFNDLSIILSTEARTVLVSFISLSQENLYRCIPIRLTNISRAALSSLFILTFCFVILITTESSAAMTHCTKRKLVINKTAAIQKRPLNNISFCLLSKSNELYLKSVQLCSASGSTFIACYWFFSFFSSCSAGGFF